MKHEYELIPHPQMASVHAFLVRVDYRALHAHIEIEIGIVLEGILHIKTNRGEVTIREGDMYYLNPMEFHELLSEEGTVLILAMQVHESMIKPYFPKIHNLFIQDFSIHPYFQNAESNYQFCIMLSCRFMRLYLECSPYYEFHCAALLNQLFAEIYSRMPSVTLSEQELASNNSKYDRITRIIDYVEQNFTRKLLLSEIAAHEEITLTYLSHFFRKTLNTSFQNFLAERRLSYAITLLETTNLSMLDVSLACGFSDIRYLYQLCRKYYSCTPIEYRKSHRQQIVAQNSAVDNDQKFLTKEESIVVLQNQLSSLEPS